MRVYKCDLCGLESDQEMDITRLSSYQSSTGHLAIKDKVADVCAACRDKAKKAYEEATAAAKTHLEATYQKKLGVK